MTEKELVDKYLGIPYKHQGRDLKGLDCWGLIILVFRDLGIKVMDLEHYDENWALHGENYFIENYYKKWQKQSAPQFLDVLLFKNIEGVPFHTAIYLSHGKIMQCTRAGVIVRRMDGKMMERLEGIYRYDRD